MTGEGEEIKEGKPIPIVKLKNRCESCGRCCSAITVSDSMKSIRERAGPAYDRWKRGLLSDSAFRNDDILFMAANFTEITRERALEINPYLIRADIHPQMHYFTCRQFDPETKKCALHGTGNKPQICTEYPVYGLWYNTRYRGSHDSHYSPVCGWHTLDGSFEFREGVAYEIDIPVVEPGMEDAGCGC